jgi:copper resistance protein B
MRRRAVRNSKWVIGALFALALAPASAHDEEPVLSMVLVDRFEHRSTDAGSALHWDAQGWIGKDFDKLWLKTEGDRRDGRTDDASLEVLYDRAVAGFWDLQAGVRHDFEPGPERTWVAVGMQGLAPYAFDVEATAYIGDEGRTAARLKAYYELLFTQRLILEPSIEANAYGKDDVERGLGSGLSNLELGLRLRYEIRREFAPYIGVAWTRRYGGTADLLRAQGEPTSDTTFVAGLRIWY